YALASPPVARGRGCRPGGRRDGPVRLRARRRPSAHGLRLRGGRGVAPHLAPSRRPSHRIRSPRARRAEGTVVVRARLATPPVRGHLRGRAVRCGHARGADRPARAAQDGSGVRSRGRPHTTVPWHDLGGGGGPMAGYLGGPRAALHDILTGGGIDGGGGGWSTDGIGGGGGFDGGGGGGDGDGGG